jgi:gluconokinase
MVEDVSGDFASVQQLALEVVNHVMVSDSVAVEPVQA